MTNDDNGNGERLSYAAIIRDVLFAHTVVMPFFEGFTARRCKQLPIEPYHLPYLGVYFVRENRRADGDWDHGEVRFIHDITIGFSAQMEGNDPIKLENSLHRAWRLLDEGLWPDPYMMNMLYTYNPHTGTENPENMRIEGIASSRCEINVGLIGRNETPWAELQFEPVIKLRSIWPPYIPDDLLMIHVETAPMVGLRGDRHPPGSEVQRIISQYEFNPSDG
jgi:hypothetical protein